MKGRSWRVRKGDECAGMHLRDAERDCGFTSLFLLRRCMGETQRVRKPVSRHIHCCTNDVIYRDSGLESSFLPRAFIDIGTVIRGKLSERSEQRLPVSHADLDAVIRS